MKINMVLCHKWFEYTDVSYKDEFLVKNGKGVNGSTTAKYNFLYLSDILYFYLFRVPVPMEAPNVFLFYIRYFCNKETKTPILKINLTPKPYYVMDNLWNKRAILNEFFRLLIRQVFVVILDNQPEFVITIMLTDIKKYRRNRTKGIFGLWEP